MRGGYAHAIAAVIAFALAAPSGPRAAAARENLPDLADARAAARDLPRLHSLLVSWRGELILEEYQQGITASRLANVKSVSKSVISALVGVAIDNGLIPGVDTRVARYFPVLLEDRDRRKREMTIGHLLSMQSGLASTSSGNYGAWVRSRNWVSYVLGREMVSDPGTSMEYSTGSSHLLSAILTRVTKRSTHAYAQETIARPLGFTLARWPRDPQGIYFGGNEMLMTPRQMLAFGELYLRGGMAGGRQVVPRAWVETSCVPRGRSRYNSDQQYGYGWWLRTFGGVDGCFAWGFGGQYIFVFRDLDLVIVTTSSPEVSEERRGHRRLIFDLVERLVIPQVAGASASVRSGD